MKLNIKNEYDELKKILLGSVREEYLNQQNELIEILNKYKVEVYKTDFCEDTKYQMFVRDPFVVIDDKIILCNMKEDIRKKELNTINQLLTEIDSSKVIKVDDDIYLEGGDIIIHNDVIFVGQNGGRTNDKGIDFLKDTFKNKYNIIPLNMINPDSYISWIHLDCLFNPISNDTVILYPEGFDEKTLNLINTFFPNLIAVNKKEQEELATNVISLGNNTIVMQNRHKRIINILKKRGFKVEELYNYNSISEVGYSRCLTCPLERK